MRRLESKLDYQLWEQPVDISLNDNIDGETDYGECDWAEPDDPNVDIQIKLPARLVGGGLVSSS